MAVLPNIYLVDAGDAPQHSLRLQNILIQLIAEKRIGNFKVVGEMDSDKFVQLGPGDMVIALLTLALEPNKAQLTGSLHQLKSKGVKIAESIIGHSPYDNEFITFPVDLKPIRAREDMDSVWWGIERQLKEIFPVQQEQQEELPPPPRPGRTKWEKILIILVVVIALIWGVRWLGWFNGDKTPPVRISVSMADIDNYLGSCPKDVQVTAKITANIPVTVTYVWVKSDGNMSEEQNVELTRRNLTVLVSENWRLNTNGRYNMTLRVLEPAVMSDVKSFSFRCENP